MIKQLLEYANYYSTKKWHQDTFQYIRYAFYIITIITFTNYECRSKISKCTRSYYTSLYCSFPYGKFNPLVKSKKDMSDFDRQINTLRAYFYFSHQF